MLVDGMVLVARHGATQKPDIASAAAALKELNAPLLGVVINGVDRLPAYYQEYAIDSTERPTWRRAAVWSIILVVALLAIPITQVIASRHKGGSPNEGQGRATVSSVPSVHVGTKSQSADSVMPATFSGVRSTRETKPKTTKPSRSLEWSVVVQPNQTLYSISRQYFNRVDGELIRKIRALNPQITDPDNIFVGQSLLLPADVKRAEGGQNSADQSSRSRP